MYRNKELIVLASGSPRRREFLRNLGLEFTVAVADIVEEPREGESAEDFVLRMAKEKAFAVAALYPDRWIIAGDTVVCLDDLILGKPESRNDAFHLLMQLSGKSHTVRSGICVCHLKQNIVRSQIVNTLVRFTSFSKEVAEAYVATGEPLDKAGAYGIQGLGGALVQSIEGSYSGVVGLPLVELISILSEEGVVVPES